MASGIEARELFQLSAENLKNVLKKIPGEKDLIIDPEIMKPLDAFSGMSVLKPLGLNKIYKFDAEAPPSICHTQLYMIKSDYIKTKHLIDHFNKKPNNIFHVIFVPRILTSLSVLLEEEGLWDRIEIHQYMWEFIPLDTDLLSLELPDFFKNLYVRKDESELPVIARSIVSLESLFGIIPNKIALGSHSVKVLKQLDIIGSTDYGYNNEFDHLFLMDRDADYASLLLSPSTYESMLDEVYGIQCGSVVLTSLDGAPLKFHLSNKDKAFEKIRNKLFHNIFAHLGSMTRELEATKSKASSLSVSELKAFVQNDLKTLQNDHKTVPLHLNAGEYIMKSKLPYYEEVLSVESELISGGSIRNALNVLEELMAKISPKENVLRLIGLITLCNTGIPIGDFSNIRNKFVQSYGFESLAELSNLEKIGLFFKKDSSVLMKKKDTFNFQNFINKCFLIPKENSTSEFSDPSYVFNGIYRPLIVKLAESFLNAEIPMKGEEFIKNCFHLDSFVIHQTPKKKSKIALIYFIGGYTMAEVAALRTLQVSTGYQFVIAGTSNITGKSLIMSL